MADPQDPASVAAKYGGTVSADDIAAKYGGTSSGDSSAKTDQKEPPSSWDLAMTAAKQFASNFNPVTMLHGLYQSAEEHPAVAAIASPLGAAAYEGAKQQYQKARDSYSQGHYSEAAGHTLAMMLPLVGPMAANAGEEIGTGDPTTMAKGAGDTAALLTGPKLTEAVAAKTFPAVRAAMDARAAKVAAPDMGSFLPDTIKAVPPTKTAPYTPLDVQRAAPYFGSEHASSPVATVEGFRDAADSAITQIEGHVDNFINAHPSDLIRTKPLNTARAALSESVRGSDLAAGLKELDDLGMDKPLTLQQAEAVRVRLNAENQGILKKNNYDVSTARKIDPGFAAREAAAQALREGIYGQLDERGIPNVADMRRDEGSLIKLRNAAQQQIFNGDKAVPGTGTNTLTAKLVRGGLTGAGGAGGALVAGPLGAAAGATIANDVASRVLPPNLTRDALVEKAFSKLNVPKPTVPAIPVDASPKGLLTAPATPLGSVPVRPSMPNAIPPIVGGTSQPAVFGNRLQLPAATANGELTRTRLGPKPDTNGGHVFEAKSIIVRDPKTGRFKRVYTTEPKGGK
jgi:hypothetical protein